MCYFKVPKNTKTEKVCNLLEEKLPYCILKFCKLAHSFLLNESMRRFVCFLKRNYIRGKFPKLLTVCQDTISTRENWQIPSRKVVDCGGCGGDDGRKSRNFWRLYHWKNVIISISNYYIYTLLACNSPLESDFVGSWY